MTQILTAAAALTLAACASAVQVRTAISPDASLAGLRTFQVLPTPSPNIASMQSGGTNDPMLVNSISNRALRADLEQQFTHLGYAVNDSTPDFAVAYYACTKQKTDISTWDYGYPLRPRWWRGWGPRWGTIGTPMVWRGQGVAQVSDNQQQYQQELQKSVAAILAKFPAAATTAIQGQ
jgi:hypothetical protein